jgi:hypothetical protein
MSEYSEFNVKSLTEELLSSIDTKVSLINERFEIRAADTDLDDRVERIHAEIVGLHGGLAWMLSIQIILLPRVRPVVVPATRMIRRGPCLCFHAVGRVGQA